MSDAPLGDGSRASDPSPAGAPGPTSGIPSVGIRVLAFLAVLLSGLAGGFIGYAVADLQCSGDCGTPTGIAAAVGATIAAGGVAVVVVLALRAMREWTTIRVRRGAPVPDHGAGSGTRPTPRVR